MKLLTEKLRKNMPIMHSQQYLGDEAMVHTKFFTPDSNLTWYVIEGEPIYDGQMGDPELSEVDYQFFGLVDGFEKELGYFLLSELKKVRGQLGLPIERDLYWDPIPIKKIK